MPLQNRVTPYGEIIATPARGTFMGNRGILHDEEKRIQRLYRGQGWVICRLEYKGRRREIMQPGHYTELFFLDEATALAAGHRPCARCRREAYEAFRRAVARARARDRGGEGLPSAKEMDRRLHKERVRWGGKKVTYEARVEELPDGVFVARGETAYLLREGALWPWSPAGYGEPLSLPRGETMTVLTPRPTVGALRAGYEVAGLQV